MKRFISFLGTGNYQPCRYVLDGQTSPEVVYVQTVTNLFADPRCEEAVIFCTAGATEKHAQGLLKEFSANGLPPPRLVPIPDGASEAQLWKIFRSVCDVVDVGDEIVFDVTHSFRSLPVIATVLLRYLAVAKGVTIGACLYGAWEAGGKATGVAPIFDLTPFFTLDDWTHAIGAFEEYGDPAALRNLATRRLGPLCRSEESARHLNATVKTMSVFAGNVRLANLGVAGGEAGIRNMPLRACVGDPLSRGDVRAEIPELEPVLAKVAEDFADFGDNDLRNGFRAARWAARHGLLPQAYTLLQETAVSIVLEKNLDIVNCAAGDIGSREFVSAVLANAAKPGFHWEEWDPVEAREDALALKNRLPGELVESYSRLVRIRNAINHAGTNPQEPVQVNGRDFGPENIFSIADSLESGLAMNP